MYNFEYFLNRMANSSLRASLTDKEIDWYKVTNSRDNVFEKILKDNFDSKPLRVFQVGAIESLETKFRIGSGWSELFWGEHIREFGGELHICDVNLNHIANSNFASSNLKYHVHLHIGDAAECLERMFAEDSPMADFDLYYLDGADEPLGNQQTLDQFKIVESHKAFYLVDDVPTKGQLLINYLNDKYDIYYDHIVKHYECGNGMMTIDLRDIK